MNYKNSILFLIVIAGISTSYYMLKKKTCAADTDSTRLIVGTSADFPPFSFIKDGEIVGFDIDLAREVCNRLNKKMELKDMPFDTLVPQLQLGRMQMIAAGMTATPERTERVNFTKPYLVGEPLVVITLAKNPITALNQLQTKNVVVNEGYTADTYMSKQEGIVLKRLPNISDAFMALNSGRAYAFVTARNSVKTFFDQHGIGKYSMFIIPNTAENSALVISKKFPELLPCVQQALDALETDGTLQALKVKWGLAS